MNTTLTQAIERKSQARRHWQGASFSEKMAALIQMQEMAKEMARASGRRFLGSVWKTSASDETRR